MAVPVAVHPSINGAKSMQPVHRVACGGKPKDVSCDVLGVQDYAQWDALVDTSPHGTVFHYSWWLSAAAEHFDILAIIDCNRRILGGIPLPRFHRPGLDLIHSPPLTPYLGPILDVSSATSVCDLLYLVRTWGELLARGITSFDSFNCVAGVSAPDLQGFLWAGFRVDLAYTFRFPAGLSAEGLMQGMTSTHVYKLSEAQRLGTVIKQGASIEDLIALDNQASERQRSEDAFSAELLRKLWSTADARGKAGVYVACTGDGAPAAALLTVADSRMTYQIASVMNRDKHNAEAYFFILWQAIRDALAAGRGFEFQGSNLRGAESDCRHWGSHAVPVWRIEKTGTWRGALLQTLTRRRDVFGIGCAAAAALSS